MNEEEKQQLSNLKQQLLDITSSPDMLDGLPDEQRASILMVSLRNEPSLEKFNTLLDLVKNTENPQLKMDVALDLINEIDINTGVIARGEEQPEEDQDTEEAQEESQNENQSSNQNEHHEG